MGHDHLPRWHQPEAEAHWATGSEGPVTRRVGRRGPAWPSEGSRRLVTAGHLFELFQEVCGKLPAELINFHKRNSKGVKFVERRET